MTIDGNCLLLRGIASLVVRGATSCTGHIDILQPCVLHVEWLSNLGIATPADKTTHVAYAHSCVAMQLEP